MLYNKLKKANKINGEDQVRFSNLMADLDKGSIVEDTVARRAAIWVFRQFDMAEAQIALSKIRDFSNFTVQDLDVSNQSLSNISLAKSSLHHTNFSYTRLFKVDMSGSNLDSNCKFDHAFLPASLFNAATLSDASFIYADLSGAIFDGATLRSVNFTGALLDGASFSNATIGYYITLEDTAWWLAKGWTSAQRQEFQRRYPVANFVESKRYKDNLATYQQLLRLASVDVEQVLRRNSLAWYIATHGVDLVLAHDIVEPAVEIIRHGFIKNSDLSNATKDDLSNATKDTLAYILMREGKLDEARQLLEEVVATTDPPGYALYRYAYLLRASGQSDLAGSFEYRAKPYVPTHELIFLPTK